MNTIVFYDFQAWVYSGTDILWASLLERLWTEVEAVCGSRSIRWHRASISLSDETEKDSPIAR